MSERPENFQPFYLNMFFRPRSNTVGQHHLPPILPHTPYLCMYIYICIICVCMCICIHSDLHLYLYIYIHIFIYIWYIFIYVYIYIYIMYIYIHMSNISVLGCFPAWLSKTNGGGFPKGQGAHRPHSPGHPPGAGSAGGVTSGGFLKWGYPNLIMVNNGL